MTRAENGKLRPDKSTLGERITSKTEADAEADRLRAAIRSGELHDLDCQKPDTLTLAELLNLYLERYVRVRHADREREYVYQQNAIVRTIVPCPTGGSAPLGEWLVANIVTRTIERFREIRYAQGNGVSSRRGPATDG